MTAATDVEAEHLDAVLDALKALKAEPYTIQQAKRLSALPLKYNQVTVERRYGGTYRCSATTSRRGFRIFVRSLGRTEDGAEKMHAAASAIEGMTVTVNGRRSTPIAFELAQSIREDADGKWFTGVLQFTYVV